jgi:hypothetical protein
MVGDFGLATMVDIGRNTVTTGLRGDNGTHSSIVHKDRETISVKTDIFGYGVMLLEIMTGERAISFVPNHFEDAGEIMLIDQVKYSLHDPVIVYKS